VNAVVDYITTLAPEIVEQRLGRLTASRIADATARTKTGYGASRANLMAALICERLTGVQTASYFSKEMAWGVEQEPNAIAAVEWDFDVTIEPTGFVPHPSIEMAGATPDGRIVGVNGGIEVKCPNSATHIDTLLSKEVDGRYFKQMQWQMACTGWEFVDFCTFDPRMPKELQLWVLRVMRDDKAVAELEKEARLFLAELDEKVAALRALGRIQEAA
jgi:hypothetical protein